MEVRLLEKNGGVKRFEQMGCFAEICSAGGDPGPSTRTEDIIGSADQARSAMPALQEHQVLQEFAQRALQELPGPELPLQPQRARPPVVWVLSRQVSDLPAASAVRSLPEAARPAPQFAPRPQPSARPAFPVQSLRGDSSARYLSPLEPLP